MKKQVSRTLTWTWKNIRHTRLWKNLYLLFGGRTLAGTSDDDLTASTAADSWERQGGQPFKTLGPQVSPNIVNWTKQIHISTDVVILIIHNFILDLDDIELFSFSKRLSAKAVTFSPIMPKFPHPYFLRTFPLTIQLTSCITYLFSSITHHKQSIYQKKKKSLFLGNVGSKNQSKSYFFWYPEMLL